MKNQQGKEDHLTIKKRKQERLEIQPKKLEEQQKQEQINEYYNVIRKFNLAKKLNASSEGKKERDVAIFQLYYHFNQSPKQIAYKSKLSSIKINQIIGQVYKRKEKDNPDSLYSKLIDEILFLKSPEYRCQKFDEVYYQKLTCCNHGFG